MNQAWVPSALRRKPSRTPDEERALLSAQNIAGGFCFGGYLAPERTPEAYEIVWDMFGPTRIFPVATGVPRFWGVPNLISRVLYGADLDFLAAIQNSGKWTGSDADLAALLRPFILQRPMVLPIREAIDWVYSSIYTTIKAMKFSELAPVCGGAIEVALVTTDRPFRWVVHKGMDAAIDLV